MKKLAAYIGNFILIAATIVALCSCSETTQVEKTYKYYIYYLDKEENGLVSVGYTGEEKEGIEMARQFLSELQRDQSNKEMVNAIPNNISINGFDILEQVLTVDFSEGYHYMNREKELLCRGAIVLTLSQIKGVQYVSFTINGEPLMIDGEMVEAMNASSFSSDLGGRDSVKNSESFTLYFANEKGTALKQYTIQGADYSGMSREEYVIQKLISGPSKSGYTSTLPKKIQVNSVITVDNICYIDFEDNFLTEQSIVSNKLVIYSIINSILELTDIHKVQITVNGESDVYYHEDINLNKPMERNLDLVEEK